MRRRAKCFDGFNVHAARALHGKDQAQVERFCRYLARPPFAQDRLELVDDCHGPANRLEVAPSPTPAPAPSPNMA